MKGYKNETVSSNSSTHTYIQKQNEKYQSENLSEIQSADMKFHEVLKAIQYCIKYEMKKTRKNLNQQML